MPRSSGWHPSHRLHADDGQSTMEWLAVAAVVVGLVVALVLAAPGLGETLSESWRCLVSQATGGGGCDGPVAQGEPQRNCDVRVTAGALTGDVRIAVIDAGGGLQVRIVEKSDGTVEVTTIETSSLGASLQVGAEGAFDLGGSRIGLGANASIGGAIAEHGGQTVIFDTMDDARAHIIDRVSDEAIAALPPVIQQGADVGKDVVNWILGNEPPTGTPGPTHEAIDIGISGEASAVAGPASANVEAAISSGGRVVQHPDGSRTVAIEADASAAATLGIPVVLDVGTAGGASVALEVDIAADGTATTGRIVAVGEGALDDSFLPDVSSVGDLVNQLTTDLPGGEGQQTVVTAELDLTDPALGAAFGDLIGSASGLDSGGLLDAGSAVRDAVADAGTLSVETYEITDNSLGGGATANAGLGLGAEIEGTLETATLVDARYIDPLTGALVPWDTCLGGS